MMAGLPKLIYRFKVIFIKFPGVFFFIEINNLILQIV